jgi:putative hydrolase of HD superfamily
MREDLLRYLGLKDVLRAGWVRAGVVSPESVAAHSWGMAVLALKLCPPELDMLRVLELCLVHDLPEVVVGDLTPHDDVSTKAEDERQAMQDLAPEWLPLLDEYTAQATAEAVFVRSLDKLDMGLQAMKYEQTQGMELTEFLDSARKAVSEPFQALLDNREE